MRKAHLFSVFALCAAPAVAADTGKCDAVPFTLGKPAPAPKKAQKQPAAKPAPVTKTAQAKPKPAPKPRLYAPCDESKKAKKKSG